MPEHFHRCFDCGCVWRHESDKITSNEAHSCPACKKYHYANHRKYLPTAKELSRLKSKEVRHG